MKQLPRSTNWIRSLWAIIVSMQVCIFVAETETHKFVSELSRAPSSAIATLHNYENEKCTTSTSHRLFVLMKTIGTVPCAAASTNPKIVILPFHNDIRFTKASLSILFDRQFITISVTSATLINFNVWIGLGFLGKSNVILRCTTST